MPLAAWEEMLRFVRTAFEKNAQITVTTVAGFCAALSFLGNALISLIFFCNFAPL